MTSNDAADAEDVPSTKLPTSEGEAKRPNNLNDEVVPETIDTPIKSLDAIVADLEKSKVDLYDRLNKAKGIEVQETAPETIDISIKCLKQNFAYALNRKGKQVRLSVGELLPIKGLWFVVVAMATDGRLVLQRRQ